MSGILWVKDNTTFKQDWRLQATDTSLLPTDRHEAQAGEQLNFSSIDYDTNQYEGHWKVTFNPPLEPDGGGKPIFTWYVYAEHVEELTP
ncbi:MAG TPA: hypothetical protein V6D14_15970 [Coleofasciculaceae cyanobacterium]|jgi:hypothetical protein